MNTRKLVRGWALGALAVAVAVGASGCATTEFTSTWRDPTAPPVALQGQKVVALMISSNESTRRAGEEILAGELSARGVQGIAGYQVTGGQPVKDSEVLRKKLADAGFAGAVIMRVVDRRQELDYVPTGPVYGSMYGYWDYGWAMLGSPGYLVSDTIVSVETLVYTLKQDKLLWAGMSETIDPSNLNSFIKDVVKVGANEMRKSGLLS